MKYFVSPETQNPIDHMSRFFRMKGLEPPIKQTSQQEANENLPSQPKVQLRNLDYSRIIKPKLNTDGNLADVKTPYKIYR